MAQSEWIRKYLSDDEIEKISQAVSRAEGGTRAEIVPMIVKSSSAIGHLPMMITSSLGFMLTLALLPFYDQVATAGGVYLFPAVLLAIFMLSFPLSRWPALQRFLIPDFDEELQVRRRAIAEFALSRVSRHERRKGVLIFVSIMERKAVVLPDQGLEGRCPPELWVEVADLLGAELRRGRWLTAFERAIERCGQILAEAAPRQDGGNHDQLANGLVIKE